MLGESGSSWVAVDDEVKPRIERRFGMPWSRPAARTREYVSALRAFWAAWNDGEKLNFRGDFYSHTLMPPFFSPPPSPGGAPKVLVAAVGEAMTRVAGEVADGLLVHAFTTERCLWEVTRPAIETELARSGRQRSDFSVSHLPLTATAGRKKRWRALADRAPMPCASRIPPAAELGRTPSDK